MHLVVELLSETAIKHKKPFSSLEWLGYASENIFLLDGGRTCILQLPSGGTKRHALRYRALYERLRSAVSTCVSPDGAFLAGVGSDCELFAWHRDSNSLRCVQPPSDFNYFMTYSASLEETQIPPQPSKTCASRLLTPRLFVDGMFERALLVRPAGGPLLVWEDGQPSRWSLVTPPLHTPLPDTHCKEATVDVVFSRQGEEHWARCSLVFGTESGLVASTVTLRWRSAAQLLTAGQCRFSVRWSVLSVPWPQIHPQAALVRHSGALIARYSVGGRILAVAVNQRDSDVTRLVYLGVDSRAVIVADLCGAGATRVHHRHQRDYWVAGLSWLVGDALLAVVTKQGSLALLSALGEPVPLLVAGGESSCRPAPYLLLHSLLLPGSADAELPAGCGESPLSSARSAARPHRQRFSVAAHPRLPVLLCSSGYMVTLAEVKCNAPLALCDRFLSSARDLLAALKRTKVQQQRSSTEKRRPPPLSTAALEQPSADADVAGHRPPGLHHAVSEDVTPERAAAGFSHRPARRRKRVSFADHVCSEATVGRRRDQLSPESVADWRYVRLLCGRLMTAQALTVSRPGRCTQEWAGRAATVGRLARQLTAAVLAGCCGRLGDPLRRLQRLLPMLGQLAALAAFSDSGGHVTLASARVLAALVEGALRTCLRLPAEDTLSALSAVCDALLSAELSQQRPDQSGRCVDQLERHQVSALFSVTIPAGNPCSSGAPATLSRLWQQLLRAAGRLYSRQRGRLTADQHSRLAVLLGQLQARVQQQGKPLATARLPRRTPVLRRYLAGDWVGTEARLRAQLDSALGGRRSARRACRPALGLLYLHVAGGRLRLALETADTALLRCAAGSVGCGAELETALRHPAGRRLLRSLARLMARYHLASPLSVQPPHDARPEPPLTNSAALQHSVIPREMLTADISSNYLTDVWSPQQAFKMLVCCGLLYEAVWFARQLGDWRTALLVCVLNSQLPPRNRSSAALSVERLLSAQAASYLPLPAASLDVSSVRRLLLAALMAGVALLPGMLSGLVRLLRQPLRHLACVVPARQPLPAVPLYLPVAAAAAAAAAAAQSADPGGDQESTARHQLAETVQKVLSVLRAAGLLQRCTLHYLTALKQACRRRQCEQVFRSPTLDTSLEGTLLQLSEQLAGGGSGKEQQQQQLADTATHLRHLCLLLFLLHTRDKLTSAVRAAQSEPVTATAAGDSALQIVSLTATLQPLTSALAGWSSDLAALALEAALSVDPANQTLAGRLAEPLAETLTDLTQLSDANQQRLQRLLRRWGDGRMPPAADGSQLAQQLLDSCRLQQLQPSSQLQLLSDGDRLFGGPADPSPLESQPPYLAFLRTVLDVAAPAGLAATPAQPLLAGWRRWHERSQLASPDFLTGYRKMVAAAGNGAARKEPLPAGSASKVGVAATGTTLSLGLGAAPALASGAVPVTGQAVRASRSAGQVSETAAAPLRRGLFRCVSFSDIWRPTGGDEEFFLGGGGEETRSGGQRRQRSRSVDATVGRRPPRASGRPPRAPGRCWRTLPRQQAESCPPAVDSTQDSGGGGDSVSLKHPALRLSRGVSVPRLDKYEHVEKLMGWFLLWRHREIRMDLVKPFSGPRIALRPTMPDILVYIWLTDRLAGSQGRGRSAPVRGGATPMEAKSCNFAGGSCNDDNAMFGANEAPMMRNRGEFLNRGRSSGYGDLDGYMDQVSGNGVQNSRRYGSSNTAMRGYGNQGGPQGYANQGGGKRDQVYGNLRQNGTRGMGNRGYDSGAYRRYGRDQNMGNRDMGGLSNQAGGQRFGEPEFGRNSFEGTVSGPDGVGERRPRYGGSLYRPYDRPAAPGSRSGGSAPPAPGRRAGGQQGRYGATPDASRAEKWGSWDDFRAAPVNAARSPRAEWGSPRSVSAQPSGRLRAAGSPPDGWNDNTRTLVSPPGGAYRPPPEPPAGWERQDRGGRPSTAPPLDLPAGTTPGWDNTLQAVRVGVAGAQWKQMHGLDKVKGDECFMVYDDKIVRMENFTADTGATIDVVEKVAFYGPDSSARARQVSQDSSASRGPDGAPCVDCDWQPWSASNLGGQRQAPATRSTAALQTNLLQVPKSAVAGGKDGCVDCDQWDHWSASTLKTATPASERTGSPRGPVSERAGSTGATQSRSDVSMSRQSAPSERSDIISQLSDEVRQLREEQRQLKRELVTRSPSPAADVNTPQLTRLINQINDALEVGLARLQRGEVWRPQSIHTSSSLQPYVQAMRLPAPLLNAIVYDAESRHSSPPSSRPVSRQDSGRTGTASSAELDARYRQISPEQISQLVAEEVKKALREAAPGSGSSDGRQLRQRPRSTSPAPARDIIIHEPVRRTHSHDPNTASPPAVRPADTAGSGSGSGRQSSRSSSPVPSVSLGAAPSAASRDYSFLLHLDDGGAAEQMAARQVRAVQESPTSHKIIQLLHDTDATAPGGEPDLVERVLGVHKRNLGGMYNRKADNMRVIQLLHADLSEDEEKADRHTTQEIRQLDDEITTLKRALRALDSPEKQSTRRSPSDELRYLQDKSRQMEGSYTQNDVAAPEKKMVTGKDGAEHQFVSEGAGSECKVKQPLHQKSRKRPQIVYDTVPKKAPPVVQLSAAAENNGSPGHPTERAVLPPLVVARTVSPKRRGRGKRRPDADGHMNVDLPEEEEELPPSPPQRAQRRVLPASNKPETTRSTPDAVVAQEERPAVRLVSRSVFETTQAYQTSGEDRNIRTADLEPAPLSVLSTDDEIEIDSYVREADRQRVSRPITTRAAPGLAEGHDVQQQMSRGLLTRADGEQIRRRSPSPSPPTSALAPVATEDVTAAHEEHYSSGPPVSSEPLLRTVPSWGRQTDSAAGVTDSTLKSYPSYLPAPEQQRPASEEELNLELGPVQVGVSPNRIIGKLADISNRIGQAVPSSTVPSEPLLRTVPSWGRQTNSAAGVTDSTLKSYPSYLPAPEQASEEELSLELGPVQVGVSPNRIIGKLADIGNKIGQAVGLVDQQQEDYDEVRQLAEKKQKNQKEKAIKNEGRKRIKKRQKDASRLLTEIIEDQKKLHTEHPSPPAHWVNTSVPEDVSHHGHNGQQQQQQQQQPSPVAVSRHPSPAQQQQQQQQEEQHAGGGWFSVGGAGLGQIFTSPAEEQEEEDERELNNWLPFSGGGGGGALSSEEPDHWNPFRTQQSSVRSRSQSPGQTIGQSDYGHGGFFSPGIRGSTGNIQQERVRGAVPAKTLREKSSSIAQLTSKTAKQPKQGWDGQTDASDSVAPSASAAEQRLRRNSLQRTIQSTDNRPHQRHPANRNVLDNSSSVIITHSSMQAVQEETDALGHTRPGAPIRPRASAERATNRSSSSLSSDRDADDERALEPKLHRKASPARRRQSIRPPRQRPTSAASSRGSDPADRDEDDDDDDDELSSWRVPSAVYRLLGEGGTSSSDETNQATDQLLFSIFGTDI